MPADANRHPPRPGRSAAPVLLPTFLVGILAVVLAVVAVGRIQSDLADAGAVLLIVVLAGFLLAAIVRLLAQQDDDEQDRGGEDAP